MIAAKKTRTAPSAIDGGPTEIESDAGLAPCNVEVVEEKIKSCKRSAMLHGAELCRSKDFRKIPLACVFTSRYATPWA